MSSVLLLALIGRSAGSCTPVDVAAVPGAVSGSLSQPGRAHTGLAFKNNPNPGCANQKPGSDCPFVDTATECRAGCIATAGCTAWSVFYNCNTGPKPPGTTR